MISWLPFTTETQIAFVSCDFHFSSSLFHKSLWIKTTLHVRIPKKCVPQKRQGMDGDLELRCWSKGPDHYGRLSASKCCHLGCVNHLHFLSYINFQLNNCWKSQQIHFQGCKNDVQFVEKKTNRIIVLACCRKLSVKSPAERTKLCPEDIVRGRMAIWNIHALPRNYSSAVCKVQA